MSKPLVIGTRGSDLALYQARLVQRLLQESRPELATRLEVIKTTGDRDQKSALAQVAQNQQVEKGIFIKELEEALHAARVDIAVHSLKDMPSELAARYDLVAILPRANPADVLVSKYPGGIEGLPPGATVATGAVRRQSQLQWLRPDLKLVEFRGNVPTRLEKAAANPEIAATMLAAAGLERLEYPVGRTFQTQTGVELFLEVLSVEEFLPAGGQGAIAVEALRTNSLALRALLLPLHCEKTSLEVTAERAFLKELGAGCDTPVAVQTVAAKGPQATWNLTMKARYWVDDQPAPLCAELRGEEPVALAQALKRALR